jgi:hypothetical protein
MTQTTIVFLAPLFPLAIGLLAAYIASHVRNARTVPHIGLTHAEFDAAFTVWAEYRASEEAHNARRRV